jgi:hypothetical protein
MTLTGKNQKSLVKGGFIVPVPTFSIRNNCSLGVWMKSDGESQITNELDFSLLHCENMYGDLGKAKSTHWLQVWGISDQVLNGAVVFCTYIKGRSLNHLGNSILEAVVNEKNIGELLLKSKFVRQTNDYGVHYTLSFEPVEMEKDDPKIKKIKDFMATKPILMDTNIPETIFKTEAMTPDEAVENLENIRARIKANKN